MHLFQYSWYIVVLKDPNIWLEKKNINCGYFRIPEWIGEFPAMWIAKYIQTRHLTSVTFRCATSISKDGSDYLRLKSLIKHKITAWHLTHTHLVGHKSEVYEISVCLPPLLARSCSISSCVRQGPQIAWVHIIESEFYDLAPFLPSSLPPIRHHHLLPHLPLTCRIERVLTRTRNAIGHSTTVDQSAAWTVVSSAKTARRVWKNCQWVRKCTCTTHMCVCLPANLCASSQGVWKKVDAEEGMG